MQYPSKVQSLLNNGEQKAACDTFVKIASEKPKDSKLQIACASLMLEYQRFQDAQQCLIRLQASSKNTPQILIMTARVEGLGFGKFKRATSLLQEAMKSKEHQSVACGYLGKLQHRKGQLAKAQQLLQTCRKGCDQPEFQIDLAFVKLQQGSREKARQAIDQITEKHSGKAIWKKIYNRVDVFNFLFRFDQEEIGRRIVRNGTSDPFGLQFKSRNYLQMAQFQATKVAQLEKDVLALKKQLLCDKQFDICIKDFQTKGRKIAANYSRRMCWRLCQTVQAYRQINLGIIKQKQSNKKTKQQKYLQKMGRLLQVQKANDGPVGLLLDKVNKGCTIAFASDQKKNREAIVHNLSRLTFEKQVTKDCTMAVHRLVSNELFIKQIQNPQETVLKKRLQNFQKAMEIKGELDSKDQSVMLKQFVQAHVTQIMTAIAGFQQQLSNPVTQASEHLLNAALKGETSYEVRKRATTSEGKQYLSFNEQKCNLV